MTSKRGTLKLADGLVNYLLHTSPVPRAAQGIKHPIGPPVVLFGGTAQTVNSLMGHHSPLAKINQTSLLQYELRGQGNITNLSLDDCTLERQVEDFKLLMTQHPEFTDPDTGKVDLCGFSFGGRVALAVAAHLPDLVHKYIYTYIQNKAYNIYL